MGETFVIFELRDPPDVKIVYFEDAWSAAYIEKPDQVSAYETMFDRPGRITGRRSEQAPSAAGTGRAPMSHDDLNWRTSSFSSGSGGNCVEVAALLDNGRTVRDTKDHGTGPVLSFTAAEWRAFLDGAKSGEFV